MSSPTPTPDRIANLRQLWQQCQELPIPEDCREMKVDGVPVAVLTALVAEIIGAYLRNGTIERERFDILDECYRKLQTLTAKLSGEPRAYIARLAQLAHSAVLAAVFKGGPGHAIGDDWRKALLFALAFPVLICGFALLMAGRRDPGHQMTLLSIGGVLIAAGVTAVYMLHGSQARKADSEKGGPPVLEGEALDKADEPPKMTDSPPPGR